VTLNASTFVDDGRVRFTGIVTHEFVGQMIAALEVPATTADTSVKLAAIV
jgi:hypothetical protein